MGATAIVVSSRFPLTYESMRALLESGARVEFPEPMSPESKESKAARTIQAEWLNKLVEPQTGICSLPLDLSNAIVEGNLDWSRRTFEHKVNFRRCEFRGTVEMSFAQFKRSLTVLRTAFLLPISLKGAHVAGDFRCRDSRFANDSVFADMEVTNALDGSGARFSSAEFQRLKAKNILFGPTYRDGQIIPTRFDKRASFADANIALTAEFDGAVFNGEAVFTRVHIGANAHFRVAKTTNDGREIQSQVLPAKFNSGLSFQEASVGGTAAFDGVQIVGSANFRRTKIAGNCLFAVAALGVESIPAQLGISTWLNSAQIGGELNCSGCNFRGTADFRNISVTGNTVFNAVLQGSKVYATFFAGEARFIGAKIQGELACYGAQFANKVNFQRSRIGGAAFFGATLLGQELLSTVFTDDSDFSQITVTGVANFSGAQFLRKADFNRAQFGLSASWSVAARGTRTSPTSFEGDVVFTGTSVVGDLSFEGAQFHGKANFQRIRVGGNLFARSVLIDSRQFRIQFTQNADFLDAKIAGTVDFSGVKVNEDFRFERVEVGGSIYFRAAAAPPSSQQPATVEFGGPARFDGTQIGLEIVFEGTQFSDSARFSNLKIGNNLQFNVAKLSTTITPVTFKGDTTFFQTHISGSLGFTATRFLTTSNFQSMTVEGSLSFGSWLANNNALFRTEFGGRCTLYATKVGVDATLDAPIFREEADFSSVLIQGKLLFRWIKADRAYGAVFHSGARFNSIRIRSDLRVTAAAFKDNTYFDNAQVDGAVAFQAARAEGVTTPTQFAGTVSFSGAKIAGQFSLQKVLFRSLAFFTGTVVGGKAEFQLAEFSEGAVFERFAVTGEANYRASTFRGSVSFRESHFNVLDLGSQDVDKPARFDAGADLNGMSYSRINFNWALILENSRPYDRQVYRRLEEYFRSSGDETEAGLVYIAGRRRELRELRWERKKIKEFWPRQKRMLRDTPRIAFDLVQRWLFRYGVRPIRLLVFSLVLLLLGTYVFSKPGAVTPKKAQTNTVERDYDKYPLSTPEALEYSLRLFIPALEIPSSKEILPSGARIKTAGKELPVTYETYAIFHRVAGAVLVPLGLAALAGLLIRRASSRSSAGTS